MAIRSVSLATALSVGVATAAKPTAGTPIVPGITTAFNLYGVQSWWVTVSADSGQTLTGAGTVNIWLYNPVLGRWTQNESMQLTVGAGGNREEVFEQREPGGGFVREDGWWLYPQLSLVDAGGGTNVTVRVDGAY